MATPEKSVQNSVCLNHPSRQAQTRCTTCFKPICSECIVDFAGQEFCSRECVEKFANTGESVAEYQANVKRRKTRARIMLLVKLIILGAIAYGAYVYFGKNPDKLDQLQKKAGELSEKAKDAASH